ncbi:MAG TPA: ACT domain-containing protein, partial [Limnochordia bacterium]|nr:ACT domain-containing protein [Limnochordia bacterium]
ERLKLVVEGAGAVGIAALMAGKVPKPGRRALVIVSGGTIDVDMIARIIERGLVSSGRRLRLRVALQDRPGSLHRLTGLVAEAQGNILAMSHDRTNVSVPIGFTEVEMSVAVHDMAHGRRLIEGLEAAGYLVRAELSSERAYNPLEKGA